MKLNLPVRPRLPLLVALWGVFALGFDRAPTDFQPGGGMTTEEIEASKRQNENLIPTLVTDGVEQKPEPFPWKAVTLLGIVVAVITPLALRAYRQTAAELSERRR